MQYAMRKMTLEKYLAREFEYYLFKYGPVFRYLIKRDEGAGSLDFAKKMAEDLSYMLAESKVMTYLQKKVLQRKGNKRELYFSALKNLFKSYTSIFNASKKDLFKSHDTAQEDQLFSLFLKKIEPYKKKGIDNRFFDTFTEGFIDYIRALPKKKGSISFKDKLDSFFSLLNSYIEIGNGYEKEKIKENLKAKNAAVYNKSFAEEYDFKDFIGDNLLASNIKQLCNALLLYSPKDKANPVFLPKALIFSGPPGTGKTMMTKIMISYLRKRADEQGMPFTTYVVDPSIKSKWYGESERRLKEYFMEVKNPNGIGMIVFDEADAIFNPSNEGSLENSLRGLLLQELEGLLDEERGNFFAVFITNKPYSGLESALHSRAREFYFNIFQDELSYSKLLDRLFARFLGNKTREKAREYSFPQLSKFCLERRLSARDVRNAVEGYITQQVLLNIPPHVFKWEYGQKKKYVENMIRDISEDDLLQYFRRFVEEKTKYEKKAEENTLIEMIEKKTWNLLTDEIARQNLNGLLASNVSSESLRKDYSKGMES